MIHTIRGILFCSIATILFAIRCSTPEISGIEVTNGACTGMIYSTDNSAAVGAVVRLIPSGYDPSSSSVDQILTTETDAKGRYTFTVPETDFYNIIAEKGDVSCMQDSVSLLTDKKNYLDNDTLEGTGWLAGTIAVKAGNDPQQVIVLVLGTNGYTSPTDSTGTFPPLPLPAGNHIVRIFSSENGYDVFDTTITVFPGDTTILGMQLPLSYAPAVNDFTVVFDSVTLTAALRWEPADTARIKAYNIHRIVNGSEDSVIRVEKHETEYSEDCVPFFKDTLVYEISTVGLTFKEGYRKVALPVHAYGKILSVDEIPVSNSIFDNPAAWRICVDADENVYFYSGPSVYKTDKYGNTLKHLNITDFTESEHASVWIMSSDPENNLLLYVQGGGRSIYKLDSDFNIIAYVPVPDEYVCVNDQLSYTLGELTFIRFGHDGTVYFHSTCDEGDVTTIRAYDTNLKHKNTFYVPGYTYISYTSNDSIMALRLEGSFVHPDGTDDRSLTRQNSVIFDPSFNLLSSCKTTTTINNSYISSNLNVFALSEKYHMAVNQVVRVIGEGNLTYEETTAMIVSIFDQDNNLVGKHVFPKDFVFQFQRSNLLFGFSRSAGPVLYKVFIRDLP